MQKQKLELIPIRDLIKSLENAFNLIPIVPRDCVKALNKLVYNMNHQQISSEHYKTILFLILRAFTSKDAYLKSILYAVLENISTKSQDGLLGINSIIKDIDDKNMPSYMKNSALRALFSNLPATMRFEFEKFVKTALLDNKARDNAVCIASEYFKDIKIDSKVFDRIDDYHLSFFNRLPINKYTSMLEIKKIVKNKEDISKISQYLTSSTDSITFFEACKALTLVREEMAAPLVDKAINTLRTYLKKDPIEQFTSIRILSKLSVSFASKVAKANREIEDLVHVSSKTVSMLAILTLLKTGTDETAKQLSSKLEPLMGSMSETYKIMAIETIEKLSKSSKTEFIEFLKSSLNEKGSVDFKRFILKKMEPLLSDSSEINKEVIRFLCNYIEDPEYYQISMDILGLLSQHLSNSKDLIHIFNRLILDNGHVRNCVYQTLFDLSDRLNTTETLKNIRDLETSKIRLFLESNSDIKKGNFDINELGDLKDEVLKYINVPEVKVAVVDKNKDNFIKECRSILLTPENSDFSVSLIKKVYKDKIIFAFSFENLMKMIIVRSGVLIIETSIGKQSIELSHEDFQHNKIVDKELELLINEEEVINGVFEYQISPEDDLDDVENDKIPLNPFDINVLDYIRPMVVDKWPSNKKETELKFKLKQTEAISKIVSVSNMHLTVDKDSFELQGYYENTPVVIKGSATYSKYTTIYLEVICDDEELLERIFDVFN